MLSSFGIWLSAHRLHHLIILSTIYVCGVLSHDLVSKPFIWFKDQTSIQTLSIVMYGAMGALVVTAGTRGYSLWKNHAFRRILSNYWLLTFGLAILANFTIMPYKVELIHFLQYALIGFLIVPLVKNLSTALYLGIWLGCVDELYQYVGLVKLYFDYNDVILNIIGTAFGVLIAWSVLPVRRSASPQEHRVPFYAWVGFHILTAILFFSGVIKFFIDQGYPYWYRNPLKDYPDFFWQLRSNIAGPWHLITPYEGILWVILLPLLYWPLRYFSYEPTKMNK